MWNNVSVVCILIVVCFLCLPNKINSQTACQKDEFTCDITKDCIPKTLVCNGKTDCLYRNDETFEECGYKVCNETEFHCAYGACIPISLKCNAIFDCKDGSDEANCEKIGKKTCPNKWMASCLSGECIRQDQICDGIKDCIDNSDETYTTCLTFRCPPDSFQCKYGACVDVDAVCNGVPDCVDYSDELLPECKTKFTVTSELICGRNYFKCNSGLCINEEKLCNGIRDCDDGSDETYRQCHNRTCSNDNKRCNYGACKDKNECVDGYSITYQIVSTPVPFDTTWSIAEGVEDTFTLPPKPPSVCYFPSQPNNGKVMTNTGMVPEPFEPAPAWTILIYTCNEGYSLGSAPSVIVCMNDAWTVDILPRCLKKCTPLVPKNHEIECKHDGKIIPCDQACEGTVANIKCKEAFEIQNFVYQPYNGIKCTYYGNWSDNLFDCNPECGTLIPKAQALVIKGYTAAKGEFPWHAGIYRKDTCEHEYEQICGGTLISEKVVLSAAHCFWNWNENKANIDTQNYAVAVGKFYRPWSNTEDKYAQYSELDRIILPIKFRAEDSSFANDIAILILNNTIKFTKRVRPICVDWANELYKSLLKPGALGTVAGWGLTEEFGSAAEELQAVKMPYVEYETCVENLPETFRPFITHDKICAGYNNGTSICTGDSGGGIAFKKSSRYFIQGVVSVAPAKGTTCDSYQYVAFTSVPQHLEFIMEIERETH